MPPAARISDMHVCPKVEPGPVPHVGGPTSSGESTVIIGGMPAARVGDSLVCFGGPPDSIAQGEPTVIIGGKPAARLGDSTSHGGVIVAGCPTVIIGSSAQAQTVILAAQNRKPFCEECEKQKDAEQSAQAQGSTESNGHTSISAAPSSTSKATGSNIGAQASLLISQSLDSASLSTATTPGRRSNRSPSRRLSRRILRTHPDCKRALPKPVSFAAIYSRTRPSKPTW